MPKERRPGLKRLDAAEGPEMRLRGPGLQEPDEQRVAAKHEDEHDVEGIQRQGLIALADGAEV